MQFDQRPAERLLSEFLPRLAARRVLCNTVGRAQFAIQYAQQHPSAAVTCWLLDLYPAQQIQLAHSLPANVKLVCAADPPPDEVDLVAWAFTKGGIDELTRDMLQIGHDRLCMGGQFLAAIDNPRDKWLHELLAAVFPKVSRFA